MALGGDHVGHGAESAEGREIHDVVDDLEQPSRELVDDLDEILGLLAQVGQADAEEDGKKQHLQDFALGKGVDHRGRHDVHEEVHVDIFLALPAKSSTLAISFWLDCILAA